MSCPQRSVAHFSRLAGLLRLPLRQLPPDGLLLGQQVLQDGLPAEDDAVRRRHRILQVQQMGSGTRWWRPGASRRHLMLCPEVSATNDGSALVYLGLSADVIEVNVRSGASMSQPKSKCRGEALTTAGCRVSRQSSKLPAESCMRQRASGGKWLGEESCRQEAEHDTAVGNGGPAACLSEAFPDGSVAERFPLVVGLRLGPHGSGIFAVPGTSHGGRSPSTDRRGRPHCSASIAPRLAWWGRVGGCQARTGHAHYTTPRKQRQAVMALGRTQRVQMICR